MWPYHLLSYWKKDEKFRWEDPCKKSFQDLKEMLCQSPILRSPDYDKQWLLGLVLAVQQFEIYVCVGCRPVIVYTDHNPLVFLNRMRNKNRRLLNWSLLLQEYDLEIRHIKGKDNIVADCLSRI